MRLDHAWIARHIPHHGTMCLLDRVLEWEPSYVRCAATNHRDALNPLRAHGRLGAACGIEYAAQAMAVHGALCSGASASASGDGDDSANATVHSLSDKFDLRTPAHGMLASVRSVSVHVERLDDIAGELIVSAERVSGDDRAISYSFQVSSGARTLLSGRATVMLSAGDT